MATDIRARLAVSAEQLRRICEPVSCSADIGPSGVIGQEAAMDSLELGLRMSDGDYAMRHYNIVVTGSRNTGRTAKTLGAVRQHASGIDRPPPDALCIHDFASPRRPAVVYVANGKGREISGRLQKMLFLATEVAPAQLAGFREGRQEAIQTALGKIWAATGEQTMAHGFVLIVRDNGVGLTYMSFAKPGEPMDQAELEALDPDIRKMLDEDKRPQAEALVNAAVTAANAVISDVLEKSAAFEEKIVGDLLKKHLTKLREYAQGETRFVKYLEQLEKMLVGFAQRPPEASGADEALAALQVLTQVNVLVDNLGNKSPPVVHVTVPQFTTLFGRLNAQVVGEDSVRIDHTMIESGDLLRANGGYLVLDLEDLLRWGGPLTFYKLLKVIRTRSLSIERQSKFADAETMIDFRSQDVAVDVKVVLICDRQLEHLLRQNESEFDNLFRIVAEFDDDMAFEAAPAAYAAFVELCRQSGRLPEFTPAAVAKLVEYGARRAGNQQRASAEFGIIKDVVNEAAFWAKEAGSPVIDAVHVRKAIDQRNFRHSLVVRRYQDHLDRMLILNHDADTVGQGIGLAVMSYSPEAMFGVPMLVSARAYAGKDKVVLVQRETRTSGPTSNQAIAIIRGYLCGEFGREKALSLAVQLCFEQNYGGIEGDSATMIEMVTLVSAITGLPVDQRIAMTGSMSQWGVAQPIGGANWKIEGHFDALNRRGLLKPGSRFGVALPEMNLPDLMLKEEVVEAHRQGIYTVYAYRNLDEVLELFLGRPAQEIREIVVRKLAEIAKASADKDKED